MIDFVSMPISYGLNYAFDCNAYESGAVWTGYQGQEMILSDTVSKYLDGSVFFPSGKGYGYWINSAADYKDSTKYIICKATETSTSNSYNWIFSERAGSYLYTTDICAYKDGRITLYANQNTPYTDILATDYHVIAVSKSGTTATIYVDGVEKGQATNVSSFTPTNYGINTASNTNAVPSASTQNLFVKCAVHCKAAHSAYEIKTNSQWLLIQYGLAPEPLNSQMSGADAAVIAWVMAHNTEQSSSVAIQKKMYRKGIKQGADSGGNIVEPWETVDPNIEIDPETSLDIGKGGVWLSFESESSSERRYVKLYISDDEDIGRNVVTGTSWEYRGNIVAEVYDYTGALLATNRMITSSGSAVWTSELNKANTGRVTSTAELVKIVAYADSSYASCSLHRISYDGSGNVLEDEIYGPALNLYLLELGTRDTDFVYTGASNTQPI